MQNEELNSAVGTGEGDLGWLPGTGPDLGEAGEGLELSMQARPEDTAAGRVQTSLETPSPLYRWED